MFRLESGRLPFPGVQVSPCVRAVLWRALYCGVKKMASPHEVKSRRMVAESSLGDSLWDLCVALL